MEKAKHEATMWDDLDTAMLRAKKICPEIELPMANDLEEIGFYKVIEAINKLCDKWDKPTILMPGR